MIIFQSKTFFFENNACLLKPRGYFGNMENQNNQFLGDCRDEDLIDALFGSVSDFACAVENNGDNFQIGKTLVKYDEKNDIHSFFQSK